MVSLARTSVIVTFVCSIDTGVVSIGLRFALENQVHFGPTACVGIVQMSCRLIYGLDVILSIILQKPACDL